LEYSARPLPQQQKMKFLFFESVIGMFSAPAASAKKKNQNQT
jgi:hypothetical protein